MNNYIDEEFSAIIEPIVENKEFQRTKEITHHGITRFDHSMRVAYFSYKVSKGLRLDYKETTEAALLHDFFLDEVDCENEVAKLRRHPKYAVENSLKYFDLTEKQVDIIKCHMFPVTFTPPKYLESWVVDLVDDAAAIYEGYYSMRKEISTAVMFLMILFVNFVRMR